MRAMDYSIGSQFQSTHPQGCDSAGASAPEVPCSFNPRTRKGATLSPLEGIASRAVSIHAPARVRLPADGGRCRSLRFQSTHPQGCDGVEVAAMLSGEVSIHAPARVRRRADRQPAGVIGVSIHAPARVRHQLSDLGTAAPGFQSTHPQGCDGSCRPGGRHGRCFNPRTRKGATGRRMPGRRCWRFQSTHPQGCDDGEPHGPPVNIVSIHAPARVRPSTSLG